ncbi:hypothetical protein NP233_g5185 [Leucocoprinus birnbaumii]|uniref:Uncharacterized protein n=1 Tax=Leucocoprinus birnbaumii TaxID=56174 RepID=A0AAD5YWN1_9AGAR|nr:hypothetical protein NP233_g5185 [Leucocoprinus birnbaumii]
MPSNDHITSDLSSSQSEKSPLISLVGSSSSPTDQGLTARRGRFHLIRCVLFFILEAGYIILAAYLRRTPLPIPHYVAGKYKLDSIKSGVTTISILWHTIAGIFASDILADSFSREWSAIKGPPTDRVSLITAGVIDRLLHLFLAKSTRTFKFTLCTSVLLFVLLRIGPSTIIVTFGYEYDDIPIGGLMLGSSDISRAVLKVEQLLGLNTGFETERNWIIPRPASNASKFAIIDYSSDIIRFNHTCQWYPPAFTTTGGQAQVTLGGETFNWTGFTTVPEQANSTTNGTSVSFLQQSNINSGLFAFLIFGGNATIPLQYDNQPNDTSSLGQNILKRATISTSAGTSPNDGFSTSAIDTTTGTSPNDGYSIATPLDTMTGTSPNDGYSLVASPGGGVVFAPSSGLIPTNNTIDLSGLQTVYQPALYNFSTSRFKTPTTNSSDLVFRAPLVTALLCNPQPVLSTGYIQLASNKLTVQSYTLNSSQSRNIDPKDIPIFFSSALEGVDEDIIMVSTQKSKFQPVFVDFSPLATRLLLPPIGGNASSWANASLAPLSLGDIGRRMDAFVLSVSKVQRVDGVEGTGETFGTTGSDTRRLPATLISQGQVLTSNSVYFPVTACLALLVFAGCVLIATLIQLEGRPPFDLQHILALAPAPLSAPKVWSR